MISYDNVIGFIRLKEIIDAKEESDVGNSFGIVNHAKAIGITEACNSVFDFRR